MPLRDPAHAIAGLRERRVHYDGVVELVRRKKIVEAFGVKRRRLESLKRQQAQPTLVDLVCIDIGARQSCQDRDVARARAGFEWGSRLGTAFGQ